MMNTFKTTLLLTFLTMLLIVIGNALGGQTGMIFAFGFALIMNFGSYWFSDKMVLRLYNAQECTPSDAPELYQIVRSLTQGNGMPMPKVYIVESDTPNAFATGRNPENAAVAVTTGILQLLTHDELTGVLAHELAHVKHHDTLISAIAATIAGAISMIAHMAQFAMMFGGGRNQREGSHPLVALVLIIVAPLAAALIQMAVSRSREFGADEGGAKLCGKPWALASALEKLEQGNQRRPMHRANHNPTTAHMFIVNPLVGGSIAKLFSTHPPTSERVARLRAM